VLETPHVIVGAAIATKVGNPALAIPLALASHFVLDKIPHWNPHLNSETERYGNPTKGSTNLVIADVSLSVISGVFIASRVLPDLGRSVVILIACLISVLPDVVEGPYFFLGIRSSLVKRWIKFQKSLQVDTTIIPGLLTQLATVIAAFWWILG
jgi:hypothetical protein